VYQRPLVMVECGWLFSLKAMEEVCVPKTLGDGRVWLVV